MQNRYKKCKTTMNRHKTTQKQNGHKGTQTTTKRSKTLKNRHKTTTKLPSTLWYVLSVWQIWAALPSLGETITEHLNKSFFWVPSGVFTSAFITECGFVLFVCLFYNLSLGLHSADTSPLALHNKKPDSPLQRCPAGSFGSYSRLLCQGSLWPKLLKHWGRRRQQCHDTQSPDQGGNKEEKFNVSYSYSCSENAAYLNCINSRLILNSTITIQT